MKPAPFIYRRPKSIDEAIGLLSEQVGLAKLLAGGQTLGPMINLRLVHPDMLIDISRLDQLKTVTRINGAARIGGGVTHAQFEDGSVVDVTNGFLARVAGGIAYRAIRNRGTLGGSLAHGDPAAEWPVVMTALGAEITLRGPGDARRDVTVHEFMVAPLTTILAENELIESVLIRDLSPTARTGFRKFCRKEGEFAHALAVVIVDSEKKIFRAVLGGVPSKPLLMATVAGELARQTTRFNAVVLRDAALADIAAANLGEDEYDRHLYATTLVRAAKECLQ